MFSVPVRRSICIVNGSIAAALSKPIPLFLTFGDWSFSGSAAGAGDTEGFENFEGREPLAGGARDG